MKIKDDNFFVIQGWMITQLKLKGIDLLVFAVIHGFSQDGESEFSGSLQYLCDFCGGVSRPTIISALKRLVEKGFIVKTSKTINNITFNHYKAILQPVKNFNTEADETSKISLQSSKNSLPNNKNINNMCLKDNKNNMSDFDFLWTLYPRKEGKKQAISAYNRAIKSGISNETIKRGIQNYIAYIEREKIKPQFIKMGSTWFNGECWNDDYGKHDPSPPSYDMDFAIEQMNTKVPELKKRRI